MVWSDDATTIQSETWNPDGTIHDIHYYGITGQAYTDYDVVYGANNKPVSASYSNGMTATWTYNATARCRNSSTTASPARSTPRRIRCTERTARPVSMVWSERRHDHSERDLEP